MWEHARQISTEILEAAGVEIWHGEPRIETPGYSQHETGTCRFGNYPKRFVTNRFRQCHDAPNLFVCDASVFPFPTDKTTTLSILAFALRTSEYLAEKLRRGEV